MLGQSIILDGSMSMNDNTQKVSIKENPSYIWNRYIASSGMVRVHRVLPCACAVAHNLWISVQAIAARHLWLSVLVALRHLTTGTMRPNRRCSGIAPG